MYFYIIYLLNCCIKNNTFIISIEDHSILLVLNTILMNLPKFISLGLEVVVNSWLYFKVFGLVL